MNCRALVAGSALLATVLAAGFARALLAEPPAATGHAERATNGKHLPLASGIVGLANHQVLNAISKTLHNRHGRGRSKQGGAAPQEDAVLQESAGAENATMENASMEDASMEEAIATPCSAGYFRDGGGHCEECPEGRYQPEARSVGECRDCAYYSRRRRAELCSACALGPHGGLLGTSGCPEPLALDTAGSVFSFSADVRLEPGAWGPLLASSGGSMNLKAVAPGRVRFCLRTLGGERFGVETGEPLAWHTWYTLTVEKQPDYLCLTARVENGPPRMRCVDRGDLAAELFVMRPPGALFWGGGRKPRKGWAHSPLWMRGMRLPWSHKTPARNFVQLVGQATVSLEVEGVGYRELLGSEEMRHAFVGAVRSAAAFSVGNGVLDQDVAVALLNGSQNNDSHSESNSTLLQVTIAPFTFLSAVQQNLENPEVLVDTLVQRLRSENDSNWDKVVIRDIYAPAALSLCQHLECPEAADASGNSTWCVGGACEEQCCGRVQTTTATETTTSTSTHTTTTGAPTAPARRRCRKYSRRRRATKCTDCASKPGHDPGCAEPLALATDGFDFAFSVEVLTTSPAVSSPVLRSSTDAVSLCVLGQKAKVKVRTLNGPRFRHIDGKPLPLAPALPGMLWATAKLSPGHGHRVTVLKNATALCITVAPARSKKHHWKHHRKHRVRQACAYFPAKHPEELELFQAKPVGKLSWAVRTGLKARNFKVLEGGVPWSYVVGNVSYAKLASAGEVDSFESAMIEAIAIEVGIGTGQVELSSAASSDPNSTLVQVTLEGLGTGAVSAQQAAPGLAGAFTRSITARVEQAIGGSDAVRGDISPQQFKIPERMPVRCRKWSCPKFSLPSKTRSCLGGTCDEVCCRPIKCSKYHGCRKPWKLKPEASLIWCEGEEHCQEKCCYMECLDFDCAAHYKKETATWCNKKPTWALKCSGPGCAEKCCVEVNQRCCTDKHLAFCEACRQCTSREKICSQQLGHSADVGKKHHHERLLATATAENRTLMAMPPRYRDPRVVVGCEADPAPPCKYAAKAFFFLHRGKGFRPQAVFAVKVLPDGQHAVSGGADGLAWVWDLTTGYPRSVFFATEGWPIRALAAMTDLGLVASAGDDGRVRVWSWADAIERRTLEVEDESILALDNRIGSGTLVIGASDNYTRLWDFNLRRTQQFPQRAKDRDQAEERVEEKFGEHAREVFEKKLDAGERVSDALRRAGLRLRLPRAFGVSIGAVTAVAFLQLSFQAVSGHGDGFLRLWAPLVGTALRRFGPGTGPILALAALPTSPQVVSGGMDGTIRLWDTVTGKQLWRVDVGRGGAVRSLALSGVLLLSGSDDGYVRQWNVLTGDPICKVNTGGGAVWSLAYHPFSAATFVTGSEDGLARTWV